MTVDNSKGNNKATKGNNSRAKKPNRKHPRPNQHTGKITTRQKRAFKKVYEENKPVAVAMREVGYTDATAKNPHVLTKSDGWLALLDKYGVSDNDLAEVHSKLLRSDNEQIQTKALDIGYKVKGKYETNSTGNTFNAPVQIVINPPTTKDMAKNKDV